MKKFIYGGAFFFGCVGEVVGAGLDKGSGLGFGPWAIFLSTVGTIAGLYIGYKTARFLGE